MRKHQVHIVIVEFSLPQNIYVATLGPLIYMTTFVLFRKEVESGAPRSSYFETTSIDNDTESSEISSGMSETTPLGTRIQYATPFSTWTQHATPLSTGTQRATLPSTGTQRATPPSTGTQHSTPRSAETPLNAPSGSGIQTSLSSCDDSLYMCILDSPTPPSFSPLSFEEQQRCTPLKLSLIACCLYTDFF